MEAEDVIAVLRQQIQKRIAERQELLGIDPLAVLVHTAALDALYAAVSELSLNQITDHRTTRRKCDEFIRGSGLYVAAARCASPCHPGFVPYGLTREDFDALGRLKVPDHLRQGESAKAGGDSLPFQIRLRLLEIASQALVNRGDTTTADGIVREAEKLNAFVSGGRSR